MVPLSNMKKDQIGAVVQFTDLQPQILKRFLDFGITEDSKIKILLRFPFHGPLVLENEGQVISIRYEDAKNIKVKVLEG